MEYMPHEWIQIMTNKKIIKFNNQPSASATVTVLNEVGNSVNVGAIVVQRSDLT